jgi:hypothetical protein
MVWLRVVNPSLDFVMDSSALAQADLLLVELLQQVKSAYTAIE